MHKNNVNNSTFWLRMLVKTGNVQACDTLQTFQKRKVSFASSQHNKKAYVQAKQQDGNIHDMVLVL
jgi:TPR repeat protein